MANKRKVLYLIKGLSVGGAEKLLVSSLPYLNRSLFDYQIAYFSANKNVLVPEIEENEIPITCLNINHIYDFTAIFKVAKLLRREKIDILHIQSPHAAILGRIAAKLSGVKSIVYTEHMPVERLNCLAKFGNILTYPLDDISISVSNAVLRSVQKSLLLRHGEYTTIHNGIDLRAISQIKVDKRLLKEELGINHEHHLVGTVGNLYPGKGHKYLLEAAGSILNHYPNVSFIIVGKEGEQKDLDSLTKLTADLGIQDHVVFTGFRKDVFELISLFDIFVLPSLWEGFGIVLLEAMALGKPVVASNIDGIPEIVTDPTNGFLVNPGDSDQIAEKILYLLGNKELGIKMGESGREKVILNFSIENKVKEIEDLYCKL